MYFVKPLFFEFEPVKIANVNELGSLPAELLRFIALYEKQCLIDVLGESLYTDVINSFELISGASEFTLKTDATDQIKDLINGKTYEIEGSECECSDSETPITRTWKGFVQTDNLLVGNSLSQVKKCFITDYIYYHYLLTNRSISTGTGQQIIGAENATPTMNVYKRIDRYNEFVFSVLGKPGSLGLYQYLNDNKSDYPTWKRNCSIKFLEKF